MNRLPIDILSHIASFGSFHSLSRIYKIDMYYSCVCMIQRWWRRVNNKNIIIISKKDNAFFRAIVVQRKMTSNESIWCVRIYDDLFLHYKYIKTRHDPNYIINLE